MRLPGRRHPHERQDGHLALLEFNTSFVGLSVHNRLFLSSGDLRADPVRLRLRLRACPKDDVRHEVEAVEEAVTEHEAEEGGDVGAHRVPVVDDVLGARPVAARRVGQHQGQCVGRGAVTVACILEDVPGIVLCGNILENYNI